MRKIIIWLFVLVLITMPGCASKEEWSEYHDRMENRDQAIIKSLEDQIDDRNTRRVQAMSTYSMGMSKAATTDVATDDVIMAMAWGYYMGTPQTIVMPELPPMKAPDTSSDLIRAWTPVIGMATPFLHPLTSVFGWSDSGMVTYSASDQATINVESGNSGSKNSNEGGSQTISGSTASQEQNDLYLSDGASATTRGADLDQSCYVDETGKSMWSPTCSCESHEAGQC